MTIVTADLAITLDGYIAGPNIRATDNPVGDGAEKLFGAIHSLASWRERQHLTGGDHNLDSALMRDWFDTTGAVVMGRTMFDTGEVPWGEDPPFQCPVFVLTHRGRDRVEKRGGTSYTFVTDGVHSALEQARAVAGDRNVDVAGGADAVRQFIRAGLLDELHLHVVPALMGGGTRLLDELGEDLPELENVHVLPGTHAAHLKYRLRK